MTDNEIENSTGAPAFRDQVETAVQALRQEVERRLDESRAEIQQLMEGFADHLPTPEPPAPAPAPVPVPGAAPEAALEAPPVQKGVAPVGGPAHGGSAGRHRRTGRSRQPGRAHGSSGGAGFDLRISHGFIARQSGPGPQILGSLGFGRAGTSLEGLEFPAMVEPAWLAARESSQSLSGAQCSPLWEFIDVEQPMQGALVPLSVRGKVLAFLYADQTSPGNRFSIEALQLLAHSAAQKLDLLPLGVLQPSATLKLQSSEDGGLGLGGAIAAGAAAGAGAVAALGATAAESSSAESSRFETVTHDALAQESVAQEPVTPAAALQRRSKSRRLSASTLRRCVPASF